MLYQTGIRKFVWCKSSSAFYIIIQVDLSGHNPGSATHYPEDHYQKLFNFPGPQFLHLWNEGIGVNSSLGILKPSSVLKTS